jgi:hypothetical protein
MTTPMYLPEMVSYDIAVISKLMLWDTLFDKSKHRLIFFMVLSLSDIHLDLVFINDVLICQTVCPITLILKLLRYHRKPFLGGNLR